MTIKKDKKVIFLTNDGEAASPAVTQITTNETRGQVVDLVAEKQTQFINPTKCDAKS